MPGVQSVERLLKSKIRPKAEAAGALAVYNALAKLITVLARDYFVAAFMLLELGAAWRFYKNMGFVGHIILVILYVALMALPSPPKAEKKKQ